MRRHPLLPVLPILLCLIAAGCAPQKVPEPIASGPDYGRPLPPGQSALRRVTDSARMPDVAGAWRDRDVMLEEALDQSLKWYAAPSSRQFFPFESFTHEQSRATVLAMRDLLQRAGTEAEFIAGFQRLFDSYESVGYNGEGIVLFTGYYAPVFAASRERSSRFTHALYTRPADLVTDPVTGEPQGRRAADGRVVPYYTREEIERTKMFAGDELVWVEDALSAYIIHVNGSAKLRLPDESVMYIGYAGKTDRPYASLGQAMIDAGLLARGEVTLSSIRRVYQQDPSRVEALMNVNQNYVFFTEYAGGDWPSGSLGVRVTAECSLATDKKIYPRGGLLLVDTQAVTFSRGTRPFLRFMLDQDTGGAIKAPGRADIFMGVGPGAEILAGGQYAEGRLYYFFLKPEYVKDYTPAAGGPAT